MKKPIEEFKGEYRFLSNFQWAPVMWGGVVYPTVEHAYQASKTLDEEEREFIRQAGTPGLAKRMGKTVKMRPKWDELKVGIMGVLVKQKFLEHPNLRELLLKTGDAELIEGNTWNDTFWGVCRGVGENHLGRILMKVRDELA